MVREELSTSHKLHNKENFMVSLEGELHSSQKRVVSFNQDLLLEKRVLNLVVDNYGVLFQRLHGIDSPGVFFLYKEHFSKSSSTNDTLDNEVLEVKLGFLVSLNVIYNEVHRDLHRVELICC